MERQEGKLRAKATLRSLCLIADPRHTGKLQWADFRVLLSRCQVHISEHTLKTVQDKLSSASLAYSSFIDHLDFDSSTARWFLRPSLSSPARSRPSPTRHELLHLMYLHIVQS